MVNGRGKQAWRYSRREISLNNRVFLLAQVEVQSSCTWFWQQQNFRALRRVLLGKQSKESSSDAHRIQDMAAETELYNLLAWALITKTGSLSHRCDLIWAVQMPRQSLQEGTPHPAPLLLPSVPLVGPVLTPQPHSHLLCLNSPHSQNSSALWKLLPPSNLIKETSGNL